MTSSSRGTLRRSPLWYPKNMWMIVLATKTITADNRIGSHSDSTGTMSTSCRFRLAPGGERERPAILESSAPAPVRQAGASPKRGALGRQRLELAQHGRDQLGHGRVDVHGSLQHGIGDLGGHHVEDAVNGFVAAGAQDGGAEDLLRIGVDQHLDEAHGLAL